MNKNIKQNTKHKKNLLTSITQKKQNCRENSVFHSLKAKPETKQRIDKNKQKHTKNKANIKTEKLKHTWNMKTKTKTTEERNSQKIKQVGLEKGDVNKVSLK